MRKKAFIYIYKLLLVEVLMDGILVSFLPVTVYAKAEAVLHNMRPAALNQYTIPQRSHYAMRYLDSDFQLKHKNPIYSQPPLMHGDDVFKIEASDAIDVIKYSQPDIAYSLLSLNAGMKVPSSSFSKHKLFQTPAQNPIPVNLQEESFPILHALEKDKLKQYRDMRYLDSNIEEPSPGVTGEESSDKSENTFEANNQRDKTTNLHQQIKNNFTDANDNLVSVSSDAVMSYEVPVTELNESSSAENSSLRVDADIVNNVPSHDYSGSNSSVVSPEPKTEHTTPKSVHSNTLVYIDNVNPTNLTSRFPSIIGDENVTNSLPSTDSEKKLSSGTVAGIVIAVLICVTLLSSAVIYLLYRKFNGKCTSVVESKFNSDNCGYLDDSLRSSIYLNNHIELPKESSEEMTSLDNDSFLNSLETMTIQNYWADSSKNTKV